MIKLIPIEMKAEFYDYHDYVVSGHLWRWEMIYFDFGANIITKLQKQKSTLLANT